MVNSNVDYWSTNGTSEGNDSLGSYFSDSSNDRRLDVMTDPRILYDTASGRFFASVLDLTRSQIVLVISPTAHPGSSAWIYNFPSYGCQDQPRLGVSDSLVAIGDDLFTDCGTYGQRVGGEVTVMSKADLLTGASLHSTTYGPAALYSSITPVVSLSPTPLLWFASSDFFFDSIDLFAANKVDASALGLRRVPVQPLFAVPPSLQSDPALIDSGDNRVQNAVWENNRLLLAISNGCMINGEVGIFACARYIAIDTTNTGSPSVTMDATIALDQNRDMFYPTVIPASDGTIYSVFGYSSPGETPSIGILTDPAQPSGWYTVTPGSGANESGRWGDYFGIARDPTDATHVWVAATYGTGGEGWSTTVAALGATPFTIKPPPAPTPTPSSKPSPKAKTKPKKHKHK